LLDEDLVNGGCDWANNTKTALEKAMKHYTWMADVTALQKFKHVGGNLQVISICAKFVLMDEKALNCMKSFLSGNPTKTQIPIPQKDIDYFYTKDFYVKSVFKNLCATSNTIGNRVVMEKHLLIILRQGKKYPHLSDDLREHWPNFFQVQIRMSFPILAPQEIQIRH
jgi:hypothetical protein